MTKNGQHAALAIAEKHGINIYRANPSLPSPEEISRPRRSRIGNEQRGMLFDTGSGEVVGVGGATYYEWEEVDSERFVKLYLAGIRQAAGLSSTGLSIFELVYKQLQAAPNTDTIQLSYLMAQDKLDGMTERTYRRGLRELLEKEFLYRSPVDGVFFVNVRYMFNGDRLAYVKAYHLKGKPTQVELPLDLPQPEGLPLGLPQPEED